MNRMPVVCSACPENLRSDSRSPQTTQRLCFACLIIYRRRRFGAEANHIRLRLDPSLANCAAIGRIRDTKWASTVSIIGTNLINSLTGHAYATPATGSARATLAFAGSIGVPRILQWRGFTWRGRPEGLGDEVPQKVKQNVKLVYIFNVSLYKILALMNIRAGLVEYISQTHNTKTFKDSMGGLGMPVAGSHGTQVYETLSSRETGRI